ncbi:hypothetical protein [Candidatus Venteria ishoeyi]|uniref:Uncharacterized protein n=1 Tax=Candidatus Venteria ishoeyi TaxID=1899563 RepID=A0A1H6F4U2_9GAMM|nr:hypothetical protein [Candidatus Venteria ishoeyi]SEH05150.1 Uncharacterised protein [Candidatus Venteria ishoeyi]
MDGKDVSYSSWKSDMIQFTFNDISQKSYQRVEVCTPNGYCDAENISVKVCDKTPRLFCDGDQLYEQTAC